MNTNIIEVLESIDTGMDNDLLAYLLEKGNKYFKIVLDVKNHELKKDINRFLGESNPH